MGKEHKKIAKSIKTQSQDRWEDRVTGAANWHQEEHIQRVSFPVPDWYLKLENYS